MRKRNIQKIVRLSRDEAQDLQKKAKRSCMSESGLIRLLLKGYEPREKPDERFYDVMRELSAIGNNINQLAAKAKPGCGKVRRPRQGAGQRAGNAGRAGGLCQYAV